MHDTFSAPYTRFRIDVMHLIACGLITVIVNIAEHHKTCYVLYIMHKAAINSCFLTSVLLQTFTDC